jgi:DNA-binding transcriptional LysR family regulator
VEIRHLRHFVALAEERSFTRAAARELIVQSGLSSSVRALEKDLGALLFVRGTRPVRLTSTGEALVPAARRAIQAADDAMQVVRDVEGVLSGQLRIGALQTNNATCPFASWVVEFSLRHPRLNISIQRLPALQMTKMVMAGELDCALTSVLPGQNAGLRVVPVDTLPLVLACPREHRLCAAANVELADLAGERFIEMTIASASRTYTDDAFARAGLDRQIVCEVDELSMVIELVEAGMGIAFVPTDLGSSRPADGRVWYLRLADVQLERRCDLVLPAGHAASPAARRFVEHAAGRGY